jgi:hypothetical protein
MKYFPILTGLVAALAVSAAQATTVLDVDFSSGYTAGNLIGPLNSPANTVGQNGWAQTSTFTGGNPITIASGQAVLTSGATGQDGYKAFSSVVDSTVSGNYLLSTINFSVTSASAAGDYFFHVSSPAGTTSNFYQRLYVRSGTGGFQLGIFPTSGTPTYGSTILSLNTPYTVVTKWDFLAGASNDPITVYVDPTGPVLTANTPYVSTAWTATEPTTLAAANLRIGGSTTTPGILVNSIQVQAVPEPSTLGLAAAGVGLAGLAARRRRRAIA